MSIHMSWCILLCSNVGCKIKLCALLIVMIYCRLPGMNPTLSISVNPEVRMTDEYAILSNDARGSCPCNCEIFQSKSNATIVFPLYFETCRHSDECSWNNTERPIISSTNFIQIYSFSSNIHWYLCSMISSNNCIVLLPSQYHVHFNSTL